LDRGASFGSPEHSLQVWTPGNNYYDRRLSQGNPTNLTASPGFFNFGNTVGVLTLGSPWVFFGDGIGLNDAFFGSNQGNNFATYTNAAGSEFKWQKGINWP
jgi:hypothetical protein